MTLPEILSWDAADPSGACWQLVDGEPVAMAPGSETHAALQGEIGRQIANHLIAQGGPCRLLSQPGIVPRDTLTLNSIGFATPLATLYRTTALTS